LEAYPALVARKWLGRRSYKSDDPQKQTPEHQNSRQDLLAGLLSPQFQAYYGFQLDLNEPLKHQLINDPTGDSLDACLCAIQAAWAYIQRDHHYGIPTTCDPLEGWIIDPDMLVS
jgi:hypothetical protein